MIRFSNKGSFDNTVGFINRMLHREQFERLAQYGEMGVEALARFTPVDTGITAESWRYRITSHRNGPGIEWYNTNSAGGTPVVILLQYGHGTGTGGYVQGRDFINPAMEPVFTFIAEDIWKKVRS